MAPYQGERGFRDSTAARELGECLRILMNFKGILEGAVGVEDKLLVASELSKVQMRLSKAARSFGARVPEELSLAIDKVGLFSKRLPEYGNKDFKARREIKNILSEAITLTARAIAGENLRARTEREGEKGF